MYDTYSGLEIGDIEVMQVWALRYYTMSVDGQSIPFYGAPEYRSNLKTSPLGAHLNAQRVIGVPEFDIPPFLGGRLFY